MGYSEMDGLVRGHEIRNVMTDEDKQRADVEWSKLIDELYLPQSKATQMDALQQADNIIIQTRDLSTEIIHFRQMLEQDPLLNELRDLRTQIASLQEQLDSALMDNERLRRGIA